MTLSVEYQPNGRNGTVALNVFLDGVLVHADALNIRRDKARSGFAASVLKLRPDIDRKLLDAELLRIVAEMDKPAPKQGDDDPLASTPPEVIDAALAMLRDPNLIAIIVNDVKALGVAGERMLSATLYIVETSRLLPRPLAVIIQGLTASGKSYIPDQTTKLFPPEAVIRGHKMTPEALVHLPHGALVHKAVVGGERSRKQDDDSADATRALREMLSDGRLTKLMPVKQGGGIVTIAIDQPGPIAYIESTTLQNIFDEDRNRCLILATDETQPQTRRIIDTIAARKSGAVDCDVTAIIDKHHAAQRLLKRVSVRIPYASILGDLFPSDRTDARRSFRHLLSFIEAVALLHQYQRIDRPEDGVEIAATIDDYRLARKLLAKPFAAAMGDGLSDAARRFGQRLVEMFPGVEFDVRDIAKRERIIGDRQTIRQYVRALAGSGHLELVEASKGPKPARYKLADVPLDDASVAGLPDAEEVANKMNEDPTLRSRDKGEDAAA